MQFLTLQHHMLPSRTGESEGAGKVPAMCTPSGLETHQTGGQDVLSTM